MQNARTVRSQVVRPVLHRDAPHVRTVIAMYVVIQVIHPQQLCAVVHTQQIRL